MKKDILIIRVPNSDGVNLREYDKIFNKRLGKWYHILTFSSNRIDEIKVELVNPTLWNYIKYKIKNIIYGR